VGVNNGQRVVQFRAFHVQAISRKGDQRSGLLG